MLRFLLPARRALSLALVLFATRTVASEFGEKNYVEYIAGDLPLVISAPHGGRLEPEEIPTRTKGVVQMDSNTQELARAISDEIFARTRHRPHLVVSHLHRNKLDPNREIVEAAAGSAVAEKAWGEYHAFVDRAIAAAIKQGSKAFYIDLHGQNHPDHRIELGYLHTVATLALDDTAIQASAIVQESSLRFLAASAKLPYADLLRGPHSLGALLEAEGFPCTPSPSKPSPMKPYFDGGYSVRRHVAAGQPIAGLQIETNLVGLRDTAEHRAAFAKALGKVLPGYLADQYDLRLTQR